MIKKYIQANNTEVRIDILHAGNLVIKGIEPGKISNILLKLGNNSELKEITNNYYTISAGKDYADDYIHLFLPTDGKFIINIESETLLRQTIIENAKGLTLNNVSSENDTCVIGNSEIDYINFNSNVHALCINDSKIEKINYIDPQNIWINSCLIEQIFLKEEKIIIPTKFSYLNIENSILNNIEGKKMYLNANNSTIKNINYDYGSIIFKNSHIEKIYCNDGNAILVNTDFNEIINNNNNKGKVSVNKDGVYKITKKPFRNISLVHKENGEKPKIKAKIIKTF